MNETLRQSPDHTAPAGQPQVTSVLEDLFLTKVLGEHNLVW